MRDLLPYDRVDPREQVGRTKRLGNAFTDSAREPVEYLIVSTPGGDSNNRHADPLQQLTYGFGVASPWQTGIEKNEFGVY
jgi:hypothetical protein